MARLKRENSALQNEYNALANQFYQDTASQPDVCGPIIAKADSVIKKSAQVSDSLRAEILRQELLTKLEESKSIQYLDLYTLERNNYLGAEQNIVTLKKELAKTNTWWKRNEKWVYGGIGAVLGILVAK